MNVTGFDHPEAAPRLLGAVTVTLTAAAGALDAVTFFAYNEVFASTMTGNLILLGLDVGRGSWLQSAESLSAVVGYVIGLAVGTVVAGLAMRRLPWRNAVGVALTLELALLVVLGFGYYGFTNPDLESVRAVLLVTGGAVAMGIQAAALRYVGPTGTPTNFLTGTVTNWVSGMVELHRPRWDGNSALRIVTVVVAAALGAIIQRQEPALTYLLPVVMVLVSVVLMAVVTKLNHGGLTRGTAQFGDLDRLVEGVGPTREQPAPVADDTDGSWSGRVLDATGVPRRATVTVFDAGGRFVARRDSGDDGRYRLPSAAPGTYTVVCSPADEGPDAGPSAVTVALSGDALNRDLLLGTGSAADRDAP